MQQHYANFKTVHFVKYLSASCWWIFTKTFYNRPFFDEMIDTEGHTWPHAGFKIAYFVKYLGFTCWQNFHEISLTGHYFRSDNWNEGNNPMLTSKLHILLKYLGSLLWWIFIKTSITGRDDWNEGQQPYVEFKTAHFVIYLGFILTDFHTTSITGMTSLCWLQSCTFLLNIPASMLMDFHKNFYN